MTTVFGSLGEVEACGGGDFATATGYYRPGRSELRGQVKFQSGEISPREFVKPSQSAPAFQIAALTAMSCGEFGRGYPPKPLTEGQAGRHGGNVASGLVVCGVIGGEGKESGCGRQFCALRLKVGRIDSSSFP